MFRAMRRFKQAISEEECIAVLKSEKRGVLSLIGDDGYPYGIVLSHYYDEENNVIYFHGAKTGHKIDAIHQNPKGCFTVHDEGYRENGDWPLHIKSVVCFGKISEVTDPVQAEDILRKITSKFTDDEEYTEAEIEKFFSAVLCLQFDVEHMSGKLVKES